MQPIRFRRSAFPRTPSLAALAAAHGLLAGSAMAAVQIDLDATDQPLGPLSSWANDGAIGMTFDSAGTKVPDVIEVDGVNAVFLSNAEDFDDDSDPETPPVVDPDNTTYYEGPSAFGGTVNGERTIEAWVHDDELAPLQNIIAWGTQGSKGGAAFYGYGTDPVGGAAIHWEDDNSYGRSTLPTGRWVHVAVVYTTADPDLFGPGVRVYIDGFLTRLEPVNNALSPVNGVVPEGGTPVMIPYSIGRVRDGEGEIVENADDSGIEPIKIGRIRVHDEPLDQATIRATVIADGAATFWPDNDGDGMPNWYEELHPGLDPETADAGEDADSDFLTNIDEYDGNTSPSDNDTDDDGAFDGAEVNATLNDGTTPTGFAATDPLLPDKDYDGLLDGAEVIAGTNPDDPDSDLDGATDAQEVWFGTDPLVNDGNLPADDRGPVIDLDATGLPVGPVTSWVNSGAMGQDWVPFNIATPPSVETHETGVKGLVLDGVDSVLVGPPAPIHMVFDGARSAEAWVLNPNVSSEESIIAWGSRGSPDGSNCSFNHGDRDDFGAFTGWGDAFDIGYGGKVSSDQWTHVAITYNADTFLLSVYHNGILANSKTTGIEDEGDPALSLFTDLFGSTGEAYPILVGGQNQGSGIPARAASLIIGKLKVYDRELSEEEIEASFIADEASFPRPDPEGGYNPSLTIGYDGEADPNFITLDWDYTEFPPGADVILEVSQDMAPGSWIDSGEDFLLTDDDIALVPVDPNNPEDEENNPIFDPSWRFYRFNYTVPAGP